MTAYANELLKILDEHKKDMPEICYIDACKLLCNMHSTKPNEMLFTAVCAECFAQPYYSDDELCVATKVKQRILQVRCTPISSSESETYRFKSPIELLQIGKYRDTWINEYRDGTFQLKSKEKYPISISNNCDADIESVVIVSVEECRVSKRSRCDMD